MERPHLKGLDLLLRQTLTTSTRETVEQQSVLASQKNLNGNASSPSFTMIGIDRLATWQTLRWHTSRLLCNRSGAGIPNESKYRMCRLGVNTARVRRDHCTLVHLGSIVNYAHWLQPATKINAARFASQLASRLQWSSGISRYSTRYPNSLRSWFKQSWPKLGICTTSGNLSQSKLQWSPRIGRMNQFIVYWLEIYSKSAKAG